MKAFIEKVRRTIADYRMITPGDRILVGVSGGPDSVCLLYLLTRLARDLSLRLGVVHLDHGLRADASDRDAAFTADLSRFLGWPCYLKTAVPGSLHAGGVSPEESARKARYAFFREVSKGHGYKKVALGHHASDNAELFLMRLVTWAGTTGASGIPPVREDSEGGMQIIRPLIRCTREEITAYLAAHGIAFMEDATNFSPRFLRNRVRHQLIPRLKSEFNPKIETALNRFCAIAAAEDEWMRRLTEPMFQSAVIKTGKDALVLSVEKILATPVAAQRRILREALKQVKGNLRRITFDHVEAVRFLVSTGADAKHVHLPGGIRGVRDADCLVIQKVPVRPRQARASKKMKS